MKIDKECLEVNSTNIFKFVSPKDIYSFYLPQVHFNKVFSSPLRVDKSPSFIISGKTFYFRDYATGEEGDCFTFVKKLYSIDYNMALKQIIFNLGLQKHFDIDSRVNLLVKKGKVENLLNTKEINLKATITIKTRTFNEDDIAYWNSYGISLKYLKLGNIFAISHYFINRKIYVAEQYAYAYVESKDNVLTYKIYQPFSKTKKWISGNNYSIWELWQLLPKQHDNIIITSSRKDALAIIENMNIPSTAFQSESTQPKPHVIQDILKRFKNVYVLYDNDYTKDTNWGQQHAKKLIKSYNLTNIVIPKKYDVKDFSDLVYKYGRVEATGILKQLIDEKGQ